MENKKKNCCPYCGSEVITIYIDSMDGPHFENVKIAFNGKNFDNCRDAINEAIKSVGYDRMKGFCYNCGKYFDLHRIDDIGLMLLEYILERG